MTNPDGPALIRSIQWLRGIAALAVVLRHLAVTLGTYGVVVPWFADANIGRWGVDLFFVISGFIMVFITRRHGGSWRDTARFWLRRIIRIVPLYWIVTTAVLLLSLLMVRATGYRPTIDHVVASYLFVPWADARGIAAPVLGVGWTLNFEMYFYLVFGVLLLLPARLQPYALLAWAAGSAALGLLIAHPSPPLGMITSELLLEFAAGAAIGWLWLRGRVVAPPLAVMLLLGGFVLLVLVDAISPLGGSRALKYGSGAAMVVAGALALEARSARSFSWRWPLRLGNWSYSVYLTHILSIAAFGVCCRATGIHFHVPATLLLAAALLTALAVAALTHVLLEKPLYDWMTRRWVRGGGQRGDGKPATGSAMQSSPEGSVPP